MYIYIYYRDIYSVLPINYELIVNIRMCIYIYIYSKCYIYYSIIA